MAGSLLDFGEVARTAIGFGNLEQNIRHNDIAEQNSIANMGRMELQQEQLEEQKAKRKQDMIFRSFDELDKLKKSPAYSNVGAQVDIVHTQTNLLRFGLGVDIPTPSKQELLGSMDDLGALLRAARGGTPEERRNATERLMISAPDYGARELKALKDANELDEQGELFLQKIELNKANLQRLNLRAGQHRLQQNLYTEHLGALNDSTGLAMDPRFKDDFAKILSFEKPETRQVYLKQHPEFAQAFQEAVTGRNLKTQTTLLQLNDDVRARSEALGKAQARTGEAPAELAQELTGYESVQHARQVESDWLKDPFNKEKWRALRTAQQDVRILYGETGKKLQGVEDERLAFKKQTVEDVKQSKLATDYAQEKFLERLQAGDDDNQAALSAIQQTKEKYPGVPMDTDKIKNMSKVGKQEHLITMGQNDVSRQLKMIESSESVMDYVNDLRDAIRANPAIVGKGAVAGSAIAGSLQQLRAIAQFDPGAAKFLNTETRDKAVAFYENLVYAQARSMDPSGPLDLKVVEHARKVLGDMDSLTTGPQQMLNKLDTIQASAERNRRKARRRLKGGIPSYLEDGTDGSSDGSGKALGDMSEQELLQRIVGGTQ